jgi:hypothetical protein
VIHPLFRFPEVKSPPPLTRGAGAARAFLFIWGSKSKKVKEIYFETGIHLKMANLHCPTHQNLLVIIWTISCEMLENISREMLRGKSASE